MQKGYRDRKLAWVECELVCDKGAEISARKVTEGAGLGGWLDDGYGFAFEELTLWGLRRNA